MRGREFLMKDSYSFNIDEACLQSTYLTMRNTYKNILERIGLDYKIVAADSGAIGGDASEEFHVLAETGEDTIAISSESEFAINTELLLKEGEDISSLEGKPSPDGKGTIQIKKGIEVGHPCHRHRRRMALHRRQTCWTCAVAARTHCALWRCQCH